ncbi:hypothetical protein SESBI_20112 [Sesbania bispinosa]|nr:hypothetical protein SESBI_20112 [Sesbania bispinosa]
MEAHMLHLERTSSIEREPRTLSIDQIQSARGLQPVVSGACSMGSDRRMNVDSGEEVEVVNLKYTNQAETFRDIASAPF